MEQRRRDALRFITLLGIVSLFGDITYEGARSITGPYLATLGARAGMVGLVAGLGEFIGYGLRLASGYLVDRTRWDWPLTILGYGLICSIPLLALTDKWQVAAALVLVERLGKAIRAPARDTILSHATKEVGRGWGFGIHEALDQIGAVIGPLFLSLFFFLGVGYRGAFSSLWLPALLCLVVLLLARKKAPTPQHWEATSTRQPAKVSKGKISPKFWLYLAFIFFSVAGFTHFQLISYHLKVATVIPTGQIPTVYALAMFADLLAALAIGKTYDRLGLTSLAVVPFLTIPIPFLVFTTNTIPAVVGIILWGMVLGIHETIMRAAVADLTSTEHRGLAYGIFNTAYGGSWFVGSLITGFLYDISLPFVITFAVIMEILAVVVFFFIRRKEDNG